MGMEHQREAPVATISFAAAAHTVSSAGLSSSSKTPKIIHLLILLIFTGAVALAGIFQLPVLDRDEARFVQATTQMLETGDYIRIQYQETERNKKPAGIYWLQAASVKIFGTPGARDIWVYRLPSYGAGFIVVIFVYLVGCRLFNDKASFIGTLLLGSAPVFAAETTIAKTDATLLAVVCGSQFLLYILFQQVLQKQRGGWLMPTLFWCAIGTGILIKGPIGLMVSLTTLCSMSVWLFVTPLSQISGGQETSSPPVSGGMALRMALRWKTSFALLKQIKPVLGGVILVMMIAPWTYAIGVATEGRFFSEAIGGDMLGKVGTVQEHHAGPFGYHFMALWVMFWPAALFLPLVFRTVLHNWRHPSIAFCVAWIVPSWLLFEAASTKLPHYALPLYPALALLVGATLVQARATMASGAWPLARYVGVFLYGLIAVVVIAAIYYLRTTHGIGAMRGMDYFTVIFVLCVAAFAIFLFLRRDIIRSALVTSVGGLGIAWLLYAALLPTLEDFHVTQNISDTLSELQLHPLKNAAPPVALVGYNEPSAVFMLGTDTRISNPSTALNWLRQKPGHIALVEDRLEDEFLSLRGGTPVIILGQVSGFNYSNGKDVLIKIYQSAE